jgi:NAD(P)-dependent dehydrogenase (short-subunit alcohol dehydrogenase family)
VEVPWRGGNTHRAAQAGEIAVVAKASAVLALLDRRVGGKDHPGFSRKDSIRNRRSEWHWVRAWSGFWRCGHESHARRHREGCVGDCRQKTPKFWSGCARRHVADSYGVESAAKATYEACGNVHVVCNNAGVSGLGGIDNISLDNWRWVLDVNLMGVLHGIRTFLPHIRAHG